MWIQCFDATSNLRHARRENRIRSVMILCTLKRPSVSTITKSINTSLDTKASRCRFQTPTIRSYTTTLVVHRIICIFVLITLLYWTQTLYTRLHSHTVTTQQTTTLIAIDITMFVPTVAVFQWSSCPHQATTSSQEVADRQGIWSP